MLKRVIARSRAAATKQSRAARDPPRLLRRFRLRAPRFGGPQARRSSRSERRRVAPRNDGQAGFTLVEIIVALAILALCLGVILPAMSDALWRTGEAEAQAEAASLARSLLAQAGSAVSLTDGEAAGRFDNGFRWALHASPYGLPNQAGPVRAYRVTAEVFWDDARQERSLALTTLRLGANAVGR